MHSMADNAIIIYFSDRTWILQNLAKWLTTADVRNLCEWVFYLSLSSKKMAYPL